MATTTTYIEDLNRDFRNLTGHDAFLYASKPGGTVYFSFTDGKKLSQAGARQHMRDLLDKAESDPEGDWRWW